MRSAVTPSVRARALAGDADLVIGRPTDWLQLTGALGEVESHEAEGMARRARTRAGPATGKTLLRMGTRSRDYGFVFTGFAVAVSDGRVGPAMKKLWSYMLRYMRPAISAAFGPNVGRPPSRKITTTTRPMLVLA